MSFVYRIAPFACAKLLRLPADINPSIQYKTLHGTISRGGGDTIGVLLVSQARRQAWWAGSILSNQCAMELVSPLQNGCTVTPAAGVLAGMQYALQHPTLGICFPEELDSDFILRQTIPFLGLFTMVEVPWILVARHVTNQLVVHTSLQLPEQY